MILDEVIILSSGYLAAQQQTLAHVGDSYHETRSAVVISYHSMLTEPNRPATLLRSSHLRQREEQTRLGHISPRNIDV